MVLRFSGQRVGQPSVSDGMLYAPKLSTRSKHKRERRPAESRRFRGYGAVYNPARRA
jgi:hypothetical protein